MSTDTGPPPRALRLGWLPWILLALAWFASVPLRPLFDPDEGRYAEIPREMLVSGDWVTPRFNDLKYFEKPPLQYWATAATYELVGVHPWSSRLWGVGLALACLPLIYLWTLRLFGPARALAALVALSVSPFYVVVAHLNLLDQAFTFFLSAAVLAFAYAQCCALRSREERTWMLIAWAAAALAVLSKGIVVGVLAGASLVLYTLLERDRLTWRRLHAAAGVALFLLIAAPWFVLVTLRNPSFPQFFFVHEHFARFLTTVHSRVEPWWFFLPLLLVGVLPWGGSFLAALRERGALAPQPRPAPAPASFRPLRFLLIFSGVTLVFFSASGSKLAPYILPLLPALAIVTGVAAAEPGKLTRHAARIGAGLVSFVGVGLLIYCLRRNSFVPHAAFTWVAAAIALMLAAVIVTARRVRAAPQVAALAGALAAVLAWQCLMAAFALVPPARSGHDLVESVRPLISSQTALYSVGQYRETLSPYLGRTLQLAGYEGELQFGLSEEPQKRMSLEQFAERWRAETGALAFFEPGVWDRLRREGLPGRVVAFDYHTVAVSRL